MPSFDRQWHILESGFDCPIRVGRSCVSPVADNGGAGTALFRNVFATSKFRVWLAQYRTPQPLRHDMILAASMRTIANALLFIVRLKLKRL